MPKNLQSWITLVALAVGIAAAAADWRVTAAASFFITIIFGLAAANVQRRVDRYRL